MYPVWAVNMNFDFAFDFDDVVHKHHDCIISNLNHTDNLAITSFIEGLSSGRTCRHCLMTGAN